MNYHLNKKAIRLDTILVKSKYCDELDMIEIIMNLEETFNIEISDEDCAYEIMTINTLIKLVKDKQSEKQSVENIQTREDKYIADSHAYLDGDLTLKQKLQEARAKKLSNGGETTATPSAIIPERVIKTYRKIDKTIRKGMLEETKPEEIRFTTAEELFEKIGDNFFLVNWYYRVSHFLRDLKLNIYSFFQRGKRGWSYSDTWDFDYYLSKVISEGVKHLKINRCGRPGHLSEKKWDEILDNVIFAFENNHKYKYEHTNAKIKEDYRREQLGMKQFIKYFNHLWD